METLEFIAKLVEFAAWPATVASLVFFLKKPISVALSRLASLKHGDTELTFSEINKKLIEENPTPEQKKQLTSHQVISEKLGDYGYYKLYSNGLLVQKFTIHLRAGLTTQHAHFPITFPNELLNIQLIGDVTAKVTKLTIGGFDFSFEQSATNRSIEIIASGV